MTKKEELVLALHKQQVDKSCNTNICRKQTLLLLTEAMVPGAVAKTAITAVTKKSFIVVDDVLFDVVFFALQNL